MAIWKRTCLKVIRSACGIQGFFYQLGRAPAIAVRIKESSMRRLEIFIKMERHDVT